MSQLLLDVRAPRNRASLRSLFNDTLAVIGIYCVFTYFWCALLLVLQLTATPAVRL